MVMIVIMIMIAIMMAIIRPISCDNDDKTF